MSLINFSQVVMLKHVMKTAFNVIRLKLATCE